MAGGGFTASNGNGREFEAKVTPIIIISCIMAATGGLMFGYDVGVSGKYMLSFIPIIKLWLKYIFVPYNIMIFSF